MVNTFHDLYLWSLPKNLQTAYQGLQGLQYPALPTSRPVWPSPQTPASTQPHSPPSWPSNTPSLSPPLRLLLQCHIHVSAQMPGLPHPLHHPHIGLFPFPRTAGLALGNACSDYLLPWGVSSTHLATPKPGRFRSPCFHPRLA